MAEEKPAVRKFVTSDLRTVIEGTDEVVYLKDKKGTEHKLSPLSIRDLIEFEDALGGSIFAIVQANLTMRQIIFMLYLSVRKEGLSEADIEANKWKYTEKQTGELFSLAFLRSAPQVFLDLMNISGLNAKGEVNPPKAEPSQEQKKASTPEDAGSKVPTGSA